MSTIRYFLPEDGDDELHPNVFLAPRPRQPNQPPLLKDIKASFPLPGTFHFRFKSSLLPGAEQYSKNGMAVWMDCVDDHRPVPVWKNSIIAKVSRISMDEEDLEDDDEDVAVPTPTTQTNSTRHSNPIPPRAAAPPVSSAPPPTENLLNVFDAPTPAPVPVVNNSTNLFDMDHHPPTSSHHSSTGSLLDMPTSTPNPTPSDPHSDLLGMSMGAPTPIQQPTYTQPSSQPMPPQNYPPMQSPPPSQGMPHSHPQHHTQQYPRGPMNGMNGSTHSSMNGSGHAAQHRGPAGGGYGAKMNKPKENGFDSFASKQGPFGNLNWD